MARQGGQFGDRWMAHYASHEFEPEVAGELQFMIMQPEGGELTSAEYDFSQHPTHPRPLPAQVASAHTQIFAITATRVGAVRAAAAMGMPPAQQGCVGRKVLKSWARDPASALSYCTSKGWYCLQHHRGDHANAPAGLFEFPNEPHEDLARGMDRVESTPRGSYVDHNLCVMATDSKALKWCGQEKQYVPRARKGEPALVWKGCNGPCRVFGSLAPGGLVPRAPGRLGLQQAFQQAVRAGALWPALLHEHGVYMSMCPRYCQDYLLHCGPRRAWMPAVYSLVGGPGVGKSAIAAAVLPSSCYVKVPNASSSEWWDGYTGQRVVVINDLRRCTFKFHRLFDLFDRYPCAVPVKHGFAQLLAQVFVLTLARPYAEEFAVIAGEENEHLGQLVRRVAREWVVTEDTTQLEKEEILAEIRGAALRLSDPAHHDAPMFSTWDGVAPVPVPDRVRRLAAHDDTEAPPRTRARSLAAPVSPTLPFP